VRLGKVVSSESHLQYVCQVYGPREVAEPPTPDQYALGSFVALPLPDGRRLVGIIYNTRLHNPHYGVYGPRLSTVEELSVFSPDYLDETRTLVDVAIVGYFSPEGKPYQETPPVAANVNGEVILMDRHSILRFHHSEHGTKLAYLPLLMGLARSNLIMMQTVMRVLQSLLEMFPEGAAALQLRVLQQNLAWQIRVQGLA
jgi:primosomal protein N'